MDGALILAAVVRFGVGVALLMGLLFLPAGTLAYWQGWLLLAVLFVPMIAIGLVLALRRPDLLRRRLNARESRAEQRGVVALSALTFVACFVVSGLSVRLGWPRFPDWVSYAGAATFLVGYGLYAEVLRENAYLSRTIEVSAGQTLVDTGLYGVVRHPMYAATLVMFLACPLVLGSPFALAVMVAYVPIIVRRIRDEERVLEEGLAGYDAYRRRVRYRLVPYVW